MRTYRLYFLDRENGRVKVKELTCETDAAAMASAEAETEQPTARRELWQGANLVRVWDARSPG